MTEGPIFYPSPKYSLETIINQLDQHTFIVNVFQGAPAPAVISKVGKCIESLSIVNGAGSSRIYYYYIPSHYESFKLHPFLDYLLF